MIYSLFCYFSLIFLLFFFFFNDTATTEIYTLSLHDALPIFLASGEGGDVGHKAGLASGEARLTVGKKDRKSTRLNSSHMSNSYAVCCLKKKHQGPRQALRQDRRRDDLARRGRDPGGPRRGCGVGWVSLRSTHPTNWAFPYFVFLDWYGDHQDLHSFPTRRPSD